MIQGGGWNVCQNREMPAIAAAGKKKGSIFSGTQKRRATSVSVMSREKVREQKAWIDSFDSSYKRRAADGGAAINPSKKWQRPPRPCSGTAGGSKKTDRLLLLLLLLAAG
jgi:hypothetical protein